MAINEVEDRLTEFKNSGLIHDFEIIVVDDSIRLRVVAPSGKDAAEVKSFVADALAGRVSDSQISIESAA
ncbi:MAG: hypothetical protein QOD74_438 [Variibacter sp.]|jgi:fructose 1,6-bisphosphatase|nr:hypothetical protein [Variibacter sp.]